MKRKTTLTIAALGAIAMQAQMLQDLEKFLKDNPRGKTQASDKLEVRGDYFTANVQTGDLLATGNVVATSAPYRFFSDHVSRSSGLYLFGHETMMTTCSNEVDHLHWSLSAKSPFDGIEDGEFRYLAKVVDAGDGRGPVETPYAVTVRNAWVRYQDIPVLWVPYWYYPLNTDYGWRFLPGYTSRWGIYFLSGYVYNIVNEGQSDAYSLGGSTYADYRVKNGFAVGQTLRWGLKDFGHGSFHAYNAWDQDYDRYTRHWSDRRRNYQNWGSDVDRERYRLVLDHAADFTERDSLRVHATYLSDSHMLDDFFLREGRLESVPANEVWYEHRELDWASGISASGPINKFYGGTARLPEAWVDVSPQPIWDLPANYESQTRAGYLNRDFAEYGSHDPMFRYNPYIGVNGRGADYQAFRMDTAHRVTVPFKLWDALSVVPRFGYRGTYWSDSGAASSDYVKASDDAVFRNIGEFGVTASGRASAWLDETWRHTVEPYVDYSVQRVNLSQGKRNRYYVFDNYDRSVDWLDQFGFEGRGLPYNWHGIRPGVRNILQTFNPEENYLRTLLDADAYVAVPFEETDVYSDGVLKGYPEDDEDGNYNRRGRNQCVPGTRIRFKPNSSMSFATRAEYDCQNKKAAYADIRFTHRLTDDFSYMIGYIGRDHRIWDYLPSNYDRWNYEYSNIVMLGFRHNVCDWLAWAPYIRYDCRYNETDEVGAWIDYLTDCLGYRFQATHESSFTRVDGSKDRADNRIMFYIYLRALGPNSMLDLARF